MELEQLIKIMPDAKIRAGQFLDSLNATMKRFGIDSNLRQAAFLAQIAHESGQLKWVKEIWGPTPAQLKYEGNVELGNTSEGDGNKYRGRGFIQITGKANYKAVAEFFGIDCINHPELLETPLWACMTAGWYWQKRGLNALADQKQFDMITKRINGGMNGKAERDAFYTTALNVLGEK